MMLAFFWSVADCNRQGCAVQWDALCKYPNHKKTHTKENKKKGSRQRKHAVSMCLSLKRRSIQIKKYGDRSIERERKKERERECVCICLRCRLRSFTLPSVPRCFVRSVARACSYKRLADIFEAAFLPPPTFLQRSNKKV